MSTTYSLLCHDCKVTYWAGQSGRLYDPEAVSRFLHAHVGCNIQYWCDLSEHEPEDKCFEYTEVEP